MSNANRESSPAGPQRREARPPERRGSFRYTVSEIPAVLGWWEVPTPEEGTAERASEPVAASRPSIHAVLMGRGPPSHKGTKALRARADEGRRDDTAPPPDLKL